jgi:hypothetical protein
MRTRSFQLCCVLILLLCSCNQQQENVTHLGSRVFYSDSIVYKGEINEANCVFTFGANNNCKIMEFSCGDFGQAQVQLSGEDLALWNSMIVKNDDGLYGQQEYYDGLFQLVYKKSKATVCHEDSQVEMTVPEIIGFKLIALRDSVTGAIDSSSVELIIR